MNNSISIYLDKLRISRNITREKFVEGILSERQYRRYLKGESTMPNDKVYSLVSRLGLDLTYVYSNFFSNENEERIKVEKIYRLIQKSKFNEAQQEIKNFKTDVFRNESNKKLYDICKIITDHELKLDPLSISLSKMKELIDYPKCLEVKEPSFSEIIALIFISGGIIKLQEDESVLNYLTELLNSKSIKNNINRQYWLPSIYFTVARSHGILGHYETVLKISKLGIQFCIESEIMNSMIHLLYLKAYSNFKLENHNECIVDVRNIFNLLNLIQNEEKSAKFKSLIEKHMGYNEKNV